MINCTSLSNGETFVALLGILWSRNQSYKVQTWVAYARGCLRGERSGRQNLSWILYNFLTLKYRLFGRQKVKRMSIWKLNHEAGTFVLKQDSKTHIILPLLQECRSNISTACTCCVSLSFELYITSGRFACGSLAWCQGKQARSEFKHLSKRRRGSMIVISALKWICWLISWGVCEKIKKCKCRHYQQLQARKHFSVLCGAGNIAMWAFIEGNGCR